MITIDCGGYQGPASVHTRGLAALADALVRLSNGQVAASITPDITASGSKATELLARVERGDTDLCYFASSYLAARIPALSVFDLPFALPVREAAYRLLDGELGRLIAGAVAGATGYKLLGFWDNGVRHLSNRLRPLRGPQDCQGLSIRTLDNALHHQVFGSFGFIPITIDVRDLPAAVTSHQVDAQENPLTNTVNFRLYETHPFHSLTGHFFGVALLLVNREWYERLDSETRTILNQAASEATQAQRANAAAEDTRCLAILKQANAQILGPAELDLASFRNVTASIRQRELAQLDPALRQTLEL